MPQEKKISASPQVDSTCWARKSCKSGTFFKHTDCTIYIYVIDSQSAIDLESVNKNKIYGFNEEYWELKEERVNLQNMCLAYGFSKSCAICRLSRKRMQNFPQLYGFLKLLFCMMQCHVVKCPQIAVNSGDVVSI